VRRIYSLIGFVLVCSCSVLAQAQEIAWEETFDDPNCLGRADFYVSHQYSAKGWDGSLLIKEFKDGTFCYGLKYDDTRYGFEASRNDRVHLDYGIGEAAPEWGPFDLKQYPVVEIKWRGTYLELWYCTETRSGKRQSDYVQWTSRGRDPDEWRIETFRVSPDSSVPGPESATKLLGIKPLVFLSPRDGKDSTLEFDYIRVRGLNDAEAAAEAKVIEMLADFPQDRWRGFDDFFPWGMYCGYLRNVFEYWGGDYEGVFGNYTRHHLNYMPGSDEIEIGRFGFDPERYLNQMQPLVDSAKATGMRMSADIRRMPGMEYNEALPIIKRLAKTFSDDDVIVSWYVYDEPQRKSVLPVATITRAIHEADPLKRPALVVFNSLVKFGAFLPYLDFTIMDHYSINEGRRDPWSVRDEAREYRKLLPDKPMWVILPAFETYPPLSPGSFARASDAEFRMMSYLAIAEGAKGILWFINWFSASDFVGATDRTGLPRGGMMDTMSDLGERLIPIGKQLLATDPVDNPKIKMVQLAEPKEEGHLLAVSALKHRKENIHFLVAVNEDLDQPRSAKVGLDPTILKSGQGVYDLYALDGKNLTEPGGRTFTVSPLAGGDGRFYVVCDKNTFENLRAKILCEKALEAIRVLKPDITIAQRWGLDLSDVDKAIESCKKSVKANSAEQALTQAYLTRRRLFDKIKNDSELNAIRRAFSDMQKELAETSSIAEYFSRNPKWWTGGDHVTWIPNPGFFDLSQRYWNVGRSYRDCYTEYLKGNKESLWEKVNKARNECLKMRVDMLAFLRKKLKPATESPAWNPKK
jgi:hypothetical protein